MYIRKIILAGCLLLLMAGCAEKMRKESEVSFENAQVYLNEKPYTGQVWSDDGTTWCLTATEGTPTAFTLYHNNGQQAFAMTSPADTLQAFDEQGAPISIDTFAVRYKELARQIPALIQRINGTTADTTNLQP